MFEAKMAQAGLSQAAAKAFMNNYEQLVSGVTGMVRCCRFVGTLRISSMNFLSAPVPRG